MDRESYYIQQVRKYVGKINYSNAYSIGDDSVLIEGSGTYLTVTTDNTTEGIHFTPKIPIHGIVHKAIKRSITDTLAFGAKPKCLLMNCVFNRRATKRYINQIAKSTAEICNRYKIELIGGDTSFHNGSLMLITTVIGSLINRRPVLRGKCNLGDYIYVTGEIGGSLAKKHYDAVIDISEICNMIRINNITSMIDITDGFISDLAKITSEYSKSALIMEDLLPIMKNCTLSSAFYEGEDYEFIMTSRQRNIKTKSLKVTRIGRIIRGRGIILQNKDGERKKILIRGWSYK